MNCVPEELYDVTKIIMNRYMGVNSTISLMNTIGKMKDDSARSMYRVQEMVEKKYDWIRTEDFLRVIKKWKSRTPKQTIKVSEKNKQGEKRS